MNSWWTAVLNFLQSLIKPVCDFLTSFFIWVAAEEYSENQALKKKVDAQKKQLDLANAPDVEPSAIRDRMRSGDL